MEDNIYKTKGIQWKREEWTKEQTVETRQSGVGEEERENKRKMEDRTGQKDMDTYYEEEKNITEGETSYINSERFG